MTASEIATVWSLRPSFSYNYRTRFWIQHRTFLGRSYRSYRWLHHDWLYLVIETQNWQYVQTVGHPFHQLRGDLDQFRDDMVLVKLAEH